MEATERTRERPLVAEAGLDSADECRAWYAGQWYPAREVARGAAYELFSDVEMDDFPPNPVLGARWPFHRFVHVTEVIPAGRAREGDPQDRQRRLERPLAAPVSQAVSWPLIHAMSQIAPACHEPGAAAMIATIRRSATIARGTPMMKILTGQQVAEYLGGRALSGFCFREFDIAHLRTPTDLGPLSDRQGANDEVVFALRWRAVDPLDYAIPFDKAMKPSGSGEVDVTEIANIPPSYRIGPQVLGTGFVPNGRNLVPEWMITDGASLPMPVGTSIVAFTAEGTEVVLYTYQPEQHAWLRMCGPKWRHLLRSVPTAGAVGQELFQIPTSPVRLHGYHEGRPVEVIPDPPGDFRIAAKTRAERHPVSALVRLRRHASWQDSPCSVIGADGDWCHIRLASPDANAVRRSGVNPVERGVYEAWVPLKELDDDKGVEIWYELP